MLGVRRPWRPRGRDDHRQFDSGSRERPEERGLVATSACHSCALPANGIARVLGRAARASHIRGDPQPRLRPPESSPPRSVAVGRLTGPVQSVFSLSLTIRPRVAAAPVPRSATVKPQPMSVVADHKRCTRVVEAFALAPFEWMASAASGRRAGLARNQAGRSRSPRRRPAAAVDDELGVGGLTLGSVASLGAEPETRSGCHGPRTPFSSRFAPVPRTRAIRTQGAHDARDGLLSAASVALRAALV